MVKISFQQPAAGLKPEKEAAGSAANYETKAEILLPQDLEEQPLPLPVQSRRPLSRIFYLTMILMLLLLGLILTSVYIYRYFSITVANEYGLEDEKILECDLSYVDEFREQLELRENVRIYLDEDYEQISVPKSRFGESDPADIIHDFQRGLTAYLDITLDKCFIIELNTTTVMPLQNFWELLVNVKKGAYLPQTYIIQEEMIVTEHITDVYELGIFVYPLCHNKETYMLKRRTARRHIHRRAAEKCHHIRHFENTFVVDTAICQKL
ncbi:integral membrane protein 2C [Rhineura floridana]|uniref:integral membrane protein 2C n=1 Tax=Rhineura floridana TaxID=261503 RepID=UPI002AC8514D|nr:integral membrane protein 2C [Rhineura floridana]